MSLLSSRLSSRQSLQPLQVPPSYRILAIVTALPVPNRIIVRNNHFYVFTEVDRHELMQSSILRLLQRLNLWSNSRMHHRKELVPRSTLLQPLLSRDSYRHGPAMQELPDWMQNEYLGDDYYHYWVY